MQAQKNRVLRPQHKKRHGLHHNQGKHYVRVYWPYMPLLLIIALGMFVHSSPARWDVLAYATDLSSHELLHSTNEQRARHGNGSLKLNGNLSAAAQAKANDMASRNYWSHNTPEGNEPWIFIADAGYSYKKAGENLAYGFTNSGATISGWMNSPSHKANMLDGDYQEVGFGYANSSDFQSKGEVTIIVAMYGSPVGGPASSSQSPVVPHTVNTAAPVVESTVQPVSLAQTISGSGQVPWLPFAVGLVSGLAVAILVIKHGLALRRLLLRGEAFFLHHPVFDMVLIVIIVAGLMMSRTAGFIV